MKRLLPLLFLAACAAPQSIGSSRSALTSDDGEFTLICRIEPKESTDAGSTHLDGGGVVPPDAGSSDGGLPQKVDAGTPDALTWSLTTSGPRILNRDGTTFRGRGANLPDAHSCGAGVTNSSWAEVQRRIGVARNTWKMNLLRIDLENPSTAPDAYFAGLLQTVQLARTQHPGLYLIVSIWIDPTLTNSANDSTRHGAPTAATVPAWTRIATLLRDEPNAILGIANEPRGQADAVVIAAYKAVHDAIRAAEAPGKQHLLLVQGTQSWARTAAPWVGNLPGPNVAVEIHVYDPPSEYAAMLAPSASLPLLIGEYGRGNTRTDEDVLALMRGAERRDIPHTVWVMHPRCYNTGIPIINTAEPALGVSLMTPTPWGQKVKDWLSAPWGSL
jgi:hypothetical protein